MKISVFQVMDLKFLGRVVKHIYFFLGKKLVLKTLKMELPKFSSTTSKMITKIWIYFIRYHIITDTSKTIFEIWILQNHHRNVSKQSQSLPKNLENLAKYLFC